MSFENDTHEYAAMNQDIKILIVDDDPDVLSASSRIVTSEGYQVFEATSGQAGLEMAQKIKPDLILLDVMLPDIQGTEVCRQIKADPFLGDSFIVLMSGLKTASSDQADGLYGGADGYIARPISNPEFKARVHAMVRILMAGRKKAHEALKASHDDLAMRNRMLNFFLIHPNFNALPYILELLQKQFESPHGYFGYFNGKGDLVIPPDACHVPGRLAKKDWAGLGKTSLKQKKSCLYNNRIDLPDGYGSLKNALVITLTTEETLVGQIALMDKASDFSLEDQNSLESMAAFLAPVLQIYAEKEITRKALDMNLNHLKEKNIALNVLLEKREEDKKKITDTILDNLETLVFPYIEQLRKCDRWEDIVTVSDILETHLKNSIYPLEKSFSSAYQRLTPTEIRVADFIKSGRTSKEIAGILNISTRAVHFHRDNIRKKFDINKAKKNLRTLLLSLA